MHSILLRIMLRLVRPNSTSPIIIHYNKIDLIQIYNIPLRELSRPFGGVRISRVSTHFHFFFFRLLLLLQRSIYTSTQLG